MDEINEVPAGHDSKQDLTIHFKKEPFWTSRFLALFVLVITGFSIGLVPALLGNPQWVPLLLVLILLVLLLTVLLFNRRLFCKRDIPPIRFDDAGIYLPRNAQSKRQFFLPYSELSSFDIRGKGRFRMMVLGSRKRQFIFLLNRLEMNEDALLPSIKQELINHDIAGELWKRLEQKQVYTATFMKVTPRFTYSLLIILVLIYCLEWLTGSLSGNFALIGLGANAPVLVAQGEWYRLFTANLLHAGFLHLYLNVLALFFLGQVLERIIGSWKTTLVFLVSCLTGTLLSLIVSQALYSVGSSTGIFGLLGAMALVNWRLGSKLPAGFVQTRKWWIVILGVNALIPVFVPQIDWAAHLGGFGGGLLVMQLLMPKPKLTTTPSAAIETIETCRKTPALVSSLVITLIALYGAAVAQAVLNYPARNEAITRVTAAFLSRPDNNSTEINAWAWSVVMDAVRTGDTTYLDEAARMMLPIIENRGQPKGEDLSDDKFAAFVDTYASLNYLQGKYDEAVMLERQAIQNNFKIIYVSQYAHFLFRRNKELGTLVVGGFNADNFRLLTRETVEGVPELILMQQQDDTQPVVLMLGKEVQGRLVGLYSCSMDQSTELQVFSDNASGSRVILSQYQILAIEPVPEGRKSILDRCTTVSIDSSGVRS